ncbi:MAG: class I SAM-dependent methyltransferase [Patescibacteria group bacterium]|nr:class I SAM-dependent methyltransferase [Patescibacteria group bacterium]
MKTADAIVSDPPTQYYDDPTFSYPAFWHGREYEHEAELMALRTLFGPRRFSVAVDIGGGFGRLAPLLKQYARTLILVEPSEVQRSFARQHTSGEVSIYSGTASHTGLPDKYCDLVVMVRVLHHILEPKEAIAEIRRILKPGGLLALEFANSTHAKSRIKQGVRLHRITAEPVRVNGTGDMRVPFVNHHPKAVYHALIQQGFVIEEVLSVSNMRSTLLKKLLPLSVLLWIERAMQRPLGRAHFGPSVFVLARRMP